LVYLGVQGTDLRLIFVIDVFHVLQMDYVLVLLVGLKLLDLQEKCIVVGAFLLSDAKVLVEGQARVLVVGLGFG
jgi:hypothetical protein